MFFNLFNKTKTSRRKQENAFDIHCPETWDSDIPDEPLVVNGKTVYGFESDGEIVPVKIATFVDFMNTSFAFLSRNEPLSDEKKKKCVETMLNKFYKFNTDPSEMRKSQKQYEKENSSDDMPENLRAEFDYKMSNEEYCGYRLTLAQAEFLKGMSAENKEKICKISKDCVEKDFGTSKTRQELFDGTPGLNWDSWLFAILVKRNGVSDEKQTMFEYFSGFDELENIDLNCEYFKVYPDVKQEVIKHFEWLENPPKIDFKRIVAENGTAAKNFTGRSVKEILDAATSRGIYDDNIIISKEFEKSYHHLESIKKTPSIGTLYENEFKELLECVHNLICKSLANGNYNFSIPELENFKYNFDTTNPQVEELVKPFYEFNDGIIRNRYFNDLCRDFCSFQYGSYFPRETDAYYFSVIKNLWTDTDEKILRLICGKYTHPNFVAESFFTTYFRETGRLNIILNAASPEIKRNWNIDEQSVAKVLSPFVEMINKQNNLHCGVSIKKKQIH